MKLYIAADHAGYSLKEALKLRLPELGLTPSDLGSATLVDADDYTTVAHALAAEVIKDPGARGLLICDTGTGMAMAANRHRGLRAVSTADDWTVTRAREHEDANVLCLGARLVSVTEAFELIRTFLATPFTGEERHVRRIKDIDIQ
jgi:ribose 5-phosphate isomerase B